MAEDKAHLYAAAIWDNTTVLALLKTPDPYYYSPRSSVIHRFFTRSVPRSSHNDTAGDAYYNRGLAYQAQGRLSLAIADFSANLERLPGDYDALEARMPAYYDNKQYAQATMFVNTGATTGIISTAAVKKLDLTPKPLLTSGGIRVLYFGKPATEHRSGQWYRVCGSLRYSTLSQSITSTVS